MANKQYLSIINDSVVYFVIVTGSNGKAKNGIIACSKGVFYKKLVLEFLPSSNIIGIEQDDKNIKLILNNASYAYLSPHRQRTLSRICPNCAICFKLCT